MLLCNTCTSVICVDFTFALWPLLKSSTIWLLVKSVMNSKVCNNNKKRMSEPHSNRFPTQTVQLISFPCLRVWRLGAWRYRRIAVKLFTSVRRLRIFHEDRINGVQIKKNGKCQCVNKEVMILSYWNGNLSLRCVSFSKWLITFEIKETGLISKCITNDLS